MIMILIIIMTITELIMMNRDSNIDKDEIMMIRTMTRNSNNNDDYRTANRDNDKQEACYEETRRIIRKLIHLNKKGKEACISQPQSRYPITLAELRKIIQ